MKILELRFKNLNSLHGEWFIDFTAAEYTANGIFALTGPTGAGKSTILDAVCLALYGATPRLGRITRSSNEIMSRQTGECYAEVLFEAREGIFRCHFSHHRARKKAGAELQNPRHEIAEGSGEKRIIEHQLRRVAAVIEEKTGMDFERFTRSILLAQGGFDTFLKAGVEQKSKILEQITGTEIYTKISQKIHERLRDEDKNLKILQAEITGITILEPEQEQEIRQQLQEKQQLEATIAEQTTELQKAISWLSTINGLQKDISNLADEQLRLQDDIDKFSPERKTLDKAQRAVSLDALFATLTSIRKQQSDDQRSLQSKEKTLPELESSLRTQAELFKSAEQQTTQAKEKLKTAAPLIQKIRALDQQLGQQQQAVSQAEESCRKDADKIEADRRVRSKELDKKNKAEKNLQQTADYLKEHAQDEWLIGGLAGIEAQLENLSTGQKEISHKEKDLNKVTTLLEQAGKELDESTKQSAIRRQEIEEISKEQELGKNILDHLLGNRLLREYRAEKESLFREMAYLRKIEELEDHRARLEDGTPCPLCGAKEHPFATENIPPTDKTEQRIEELTKLINKAETLETADNKLQKAKTVARKNLTESEKLEADAANNKKAAEKRQAELAASLRQHRKGFHDLQQAVSVKLQPLGITDISATQIADLLNSLNGRLKTWQRQLNKQTKIEQKVTAIKSELKRLNAIIETQNDSLTEKQDHLKILQNAYKTGRERRKELFSGKNPDNEEKQLHKAITDAENTEKKIRRKEFVIQQALTAAKTDIESLKTRLSLQEKELKKAETVFYAALKAAGFTDENDFLEARLPTSQRDELAAREKELNDLQTGIAARLKDRKKQLAAETARKITDKSLEELQPQCIEHENTLKELRNTIAGLKLKLSENATAKGLIKKKQNIIKAQKKECRRWEQLHSLIGSADGKKYRNFAQGLTFELMVSHANRQLQKMTDRYLLTRDTLQPLELNVIDTYQAGEVRSTRNLSGGESFIVSLTLALGLSKMASRKVRVDSLFLDEGFGTLDEEALETALETLSGLQEDGKLIGIISHVTALKDRISTQIRVSPVSGGKSRITGPGCRRFTPPRMPQQ